MRVPLHPPPADPPPAALARRVSTVLIADPHSCVREGLKAILAREPDLRVVGEVADGPGAVRLAAELDPDVVVAEAVMPGLAGSYFVARVCAGRPDRKVLVLTACADGGAVQGLLAAGAAGVALKGSPAGDVVRAVRAVAGGALHLDPAAAACLATAGPALSDREQAVVRHIALGYTNKEIAGRLRVSVKTLETYKARALEKLGLRGRVEIVRYAIGRGWFSGAAPEPHSRPEA